jgi:hypothetical protein
MKPLGFISVPYCSFLPYFARMPFLNQFFPMWENVVESGDFYKHSYRIYRKTPINKALQSEPRSKTRQNFCVGIPQARLLALPPDYFIFDCST